MGRILPFLPAARCLLLTGTGGNWYFCPQLNMEGWLCPALFRYFGEAPKRL